MYECVKCGFPSYLCHFYAISSLPSLFHALLLALHFSCFLFCTRLYCFKMSRISAEARLRRGRKKAAEEESGLINNEEVKKGLEPKTEESYRGAMKL